MKVVLVTLVLALIGGFLAFGKYTGVRSELAARRQAIDAAWGQVDIALEQRADLIPDVTEALQDDMAGDRPVLDGLAAARSAVVRAETPQQKIDANSRLDQALRRLLAAVESSPRLRSRAHFLQLLDELAGAENRIAVERRKYNETVQRYNTQIELFPDNIVASLAGFTRNDAYFKTEPGGRPAPDLAF